MMRLQWAWSGHNQKWVVNQCSFLLMARPKEWTSYHNKESAKIIKIYFYHISSSINWRPSEKISYISELDMCRWINLQISNNKAIWHIVILRIYPIQFMQNNWFMMNYMGIPIFMLISYYVLYNCCFLYYLINCLC